MDSDSMGDPLHVTVVVTRTGGIAGLRRQWQIDSRGDEASEWVSLIQECPWSGAASNASGADRFAWSIVALLGPDRHDAELSDDQIDGPWALLVEAVRARGAPVAPAPRPSPSPAPPPAEPEERAESAEPEERAESAEPTG